MQSDRCQPRWTSSHLSTSLPPRCGRLQYFRQSPQKVATHTDIFGCHRSVTWSIFTPSHLTVIVTESKEILNLQIYHIFFVLGCHVTRAGIRNLSRMSLLTHLILRNCWAVSATSLSRLPQSLQHLDLGACLLSLLKKNISKRELTKLLNWVLALTFRWPATLHKQKTLTSWLCTYWFQHTPAQVAVWKQFLPLLSLPFPGNWHT